MEIKGGTCRKYEHLLLPRCSADTGHGQLITRENAENARLENAGPKCKGGVQR